MEYMVPLKTIIFIAAMICFTIWGAWISKKSNDTPTGDYSFDLAGISRVALFLFAFVLFFVIFGGIFWF